LSWASFSLRAFSFATHSTISESLLIWPPDTPSAFISAFFVMMLFLSFSIWFFSSSLKSFTFFSFFVFDTPMSTVGATYANFPSAVIPFAIWAKR